MSKYNQEDLDRMAGEKNSLSRPKLEIPEIKFKAKEGIFKLVERPENWQKGQPYNETDLGNSVKVVLLRLKRFLTRDDFITEEYDGKNEVIELKQTGTNAMGRWQIQFVDQGTPEQLKEKYDLRASANIYVLHEGCLAKIKVGGTSLFSDKYENATLLYNYVSSFDKAQDERAYKFVTQITAYGPVKFPKGSSYLMSFTRKEPLSEQQMDNVGDNLEIISSYYEQLDLYKEQFHKDKEPVAEDQSAMVTDEIPTIQIENEKEEEVAQIRPTKIPAAEEINIDDIPF